VKIKGIKDAAANVYVPQKGRYGTYWIDRENFTTMKFGTGPEGNRGIVLPGTFNIRTGTVTGITGTKQGVYFYHLPH